ncbi:MAG TPA: squalene/phytoene synthase family protein [Chitinophagaceae bacterium]|nr:squalene/phytoene synthase family protein [Chitinophagaceae bacterium]
MKTLFDKISANCSKNVTKTYSTSFSFGIYFLNKKFHKPIYGIYGWVRLADEIVDSFHNYDKTLLMQRLRADTMQAIEDKISLNPILNQFQYAVHKYNIDWYLIDTFLKSMEMDILQKEHNEASYKQYILGSAEVVGLMCLSIFVEGDNVLYEKLKPFAMSLGSAFQKVNFLRDLKDDYNILGRTYFPGVNFNAFSCKEKARIQTEIDAEFEHALIGIKMLPKASKGGVYLAYYYYKKLFLRIKETPAEKIMTARIRIPDINKVGLMFNSLIRNQLNLL